MDYRDMETLAELIADRMVAALDAREAEVARLTRERDEAREWDIRSFFATVQELAPGEGLSHEDGWTLMRREAAEKDSRIRADLVAALQGVLRVADRATDEFDAARAALTQAGS